MMQLYKSIYRFSQVGIETLDALRRGTLVGMLFLDQ